MGTTRFPFLSLKGTNLPAQANSLGKAVFITPKALNLKALGRAAHPGNGSLVAFNPERIGSTRSRAADSTPSAYRNRRFSFPTMRSLRSRPLALISNAFGVPSGWLLLKGLAIAFLLASMLFAHGCHGNEDHELFGTALSWIGK